MKLRYSATSPYVRKVMMVAIECGLESAVEKQPTDAWSPETDLPKDNPLGKVPALVLADGTTLFDSPVICEYLDTLHDGARLFPAVGPDRWKALRLQALADGLNDAAVALRLESVRPDGERSEKWMNRQRAAVLRSLDALEGEAGSLGETPTIGTIAVAAALGYIDFRFADLGWRETRPALARWFEPVSARDSYRRTAPPA